MPYLATETVKTIRNKIKKELPNVKFSITREHCTTLVVSIMESDIDFGTEHKQLNEFYIKEQNLKAQDFLTRLVEIIEAAHEQKEITYDYDYGSIPNYYLNLNVGKWDKPYVLRGV